MKPIIDRKVSISLSELRSVFEDLSKINLDLSNEKQLRRDYSISAIDWFLKERRGIKKDFLSIFNMRHKWNMWKAGTEYNDR